MKTHMTIITIAFLLNLSLLSLFLLSSGVYAQDQAIPLTQKERLEVVDAISDQLNDNYIFPDVAKKMSKYISKQRKRGHYKKFTDPMLFADQLTEDLLSVSHDKHIRVRFDPEAIAREQQAISDEDKIALQQQNIDRSKKRNFGFKELKILDGNIGYLDLRGFEDTKYAGETAAAAMNYLSNADAIIFDLRRNGGGSPTMIQLITSYLYDSEPVHLNNFYWRPTDLHTQTWTLPYVPGKRSPDTPVYVLTSNATFSAAEEFSYNLKNLERATLIGETTGGGAHPGGPVIATDRFIIGVPSGRAINPITKTNWEGVGVVPHIQVKSEDALTLAHIKALENLVEKSIDDAKIYYSWALDSLKIQGSNFHIDDSSLKPFVGSYGPRVITLENNNLFYRRGEGAKYQLIPMGEVGNKSDNKFLIKELGNFRIKFEFEDNNISAIVGLYSNGRTDKNMKD